MAPSFAENHWYDMSFLLAVCRTDYCYQQIATATARLRVLSHNTPAPRHATPLLPLHSLPQHQHRRRRASKTVNPAQDRNRQRRATQDQQVNAIDAQPNTEGAPTQEGHHQKASLPSSAHRWSDTRGAGRTTTIATQRTLTFFQATLTLGLAQHAIVKSRERGPGMALFY